MGVVKELRDGKWRWTVSRRLPKNKLGMKRFRRWYANKATAQRVLDKLNGAIATGELDEMLPRLIGQSDDSYTVAEFWDRFIDEYARPRLDSHKRYEQSGRAFLVALGAIPLASFSRGHLHEWLERRTKQTSRSNANKDIAAIKKMFSWAVEIGVLNSNPLVRFAPFRVQEHAVRSLTVDEFHRLVSSASSPEIAALIAILGETGARKSEALGLTWDRIDLARRRITLEKTKGKRVRSVPLSDFAVTHLLGLIRYVGQPRVFCHPGGKPIRNFRKAFENAAKAAGLEWVTPHTLRAFRATTWLQLGVDIRTVKDALGHSAIATTMRYLRAVESHADKAIREAQEAEKLESEREKSGRRGETA